MLKRAIALIIAVALSLSFASCNEETPVSEVESTTTITTKTPTGVGVIKLAFCANDSLDPYSATSKVNRQLSSLMFDSLFKLDNELNPQNCLAQDIEISGKTCTVTVKSARFSDGSSVSGSDIVYSFNVAKSTENSVYPTQLSNISSANASGRTVTFALKNYDINFANILDFPIIKEGSRNRKDSDNRELPPIGCGRYVYASKNGDGFLEPNKGYYSDVPENSVELMNIPDNESWKYAIRSGEIDIYYSGENTSDLPSFSGGTSQIKHTDFVYLSVSDYSEKLADINVKSAIYDVIDRLQITEKAFYTYAYPSVDIYPNTVKFAGGVKSGLSPSGNSETAVDYFSKAGFSSKNEQGIYFDKSGNLFSLNLIYSKSVASHKSTATVISEQLRKFGISVELIELDSASYAKRVDSGNYDLSLCEIKLNKNFDLSPLFELENLIEETTTTTTTKPTKADGETQKNEKVIFNSGCTQAVKDAYNNYISSKTDINTFIEIYNQNLPFIPICHRTGLTGYSSAVTPAALSSVSDAYYNFQNISQK